MARKLRELQMVVQRLRKAMGVANLRIERDMLGRKFATYDFVGWSNTNIEVTASSDGGIHTARCRHHNLEFHVQKKLIREHWTENTRLPCCRRPNIYQMNPAKVGDFTVIEILPRSFSSNDQHPVVRLLCPCGTRFSRKSHGVKQRLQTGTTHICPGCKNAYRRENTKARKDQGRRHEQP